jgi:hypothetical protein
MTDKLAQEIIKWLKESGYPLEMQVGREFRRMDVPVWQSPLYEDVRTREPREIDVVATGAIHLERWVVRLQFVVECKSSKDAPWIVFGGDPGVNRINPNLFLAATSIEGALLRNQLFAPTDIIHDLPIFTAFPRSGYGMKRARGARVEKATIRKEAKLDRQDVCYTAMMQACGAATSLSEVTGVTRSGLGQEKRNATFSVPVIVLEGRLFEARLAVEMDDVEVHEVRQHCIYVQNPGVNTGGLMLYVITKAALPGYIAAAKESLRKLKAWCTNDRNAQRFVGLAAELDTAEAKQRHAETWQQWKPSAP